MVDKLCSTSRVFFLYPTSEFSSFGYQKLPQKYIVVGHTLLF